MDGGQENENIVEADKGNTDAKAGATGEIFDWAESIVFSLGIVVLIFTFIFRPVGVDGPSMQNTLHGGERVIICNINYKPQKGDIIVLSTKAVQQPIIKRVIAVGGQTVNINFDTHKVYVDGKELHEPYIKEPTALVGNVTFPTVVPRNCVFVMGDNRNNSYDSRFQEIGMVKDENILGRAVFRIFPFNKMGKL